jgi:hypothetical protein
MQKSQSPAVIPIFNITCRLKSEVGSGQLTGEPGKKYAFDAKTPQGFRKNATWKHRICPA